MPSQSREQQAGSLQRKVGIGAQSLDRDLGDLHTWPHSHYLMRPCSGVGAAKVQLCRYEVCGCKINDLMKEEIGISILFYPPWSLGSPDPYPAPYPLGPFPPTLLCSDLRIREIAGCLGPSSASEIASDAHPLLSCNLIVEY